MAKTFFDTYKAMIITCLLMACTILLLINISLSNRAKVNKEILMELAAEDWENISEPEPPSEPEPDKIIPLANKTHQAYNEADNQVDEQEFEERYKALTEKLSQGLESNPESAESNFEGTESIAENNPEKEIKSSVGAGKENEPANTPSSSNKDSSIRFSLLKRNALYLPNPIYTCSKRGKIVVTINVNENGHVTEATFNEASSSSRNGCLVDNALAYAKRAQFSTSGKVSQIGTITYLFNY